MQFWVVFYQQFFDKKMEKFKINCLTELQVDEVGMECKFAWLHRLRISVYIEGVILNSNSTLLTHPIAQVCSKVRSRTWTVENTLNKNASMACLTRYHASIKNLRSSLQTANISLELAQPTLNSPLPHHHIPVHNLTEDPCFTRGHAEDQNPRDHAVVH